MSERSLFVVAHPDDLETMLGYEALASPGAKHALIASDGKKSTVNYTTDTCFCC
jgi:LmbE family N-acetylglucosaminyl deacetylase